jgi:hypothetical protein
LINAGNNSRIPKLPPKGFKSKPRFLEKSQNSLLLLKAFNGIMGYKIDQEEN